MSTKVNDKTAGAIDAINILASAIYDVYEKSQQLPMDSQEFEALENLMQLVSTIGAYAADPDEEPIAEEMSFQIANYQRQAEELDRKIRVREAKKKAQEAYDKVYKEALAQS